MDCSEAPTTNISLAAERLSTTAVFALQKDSGSDGSALQVPKHLEDFHLDSCPPKPKSDPKTRRIYFCGDYHEDFDVTIPSELWLPTTSASRVGGGNGTLAMRPSPAYIRSRRFTGV